MTATPVLRRRNRRSEEAILTATVDLLAEVGFAGLTIDGIAARAGVGKATIYRHWSSKAELVIEAFTGCLEPLELIDTGSLRGDLVQAIRRLIRVLTDSPAAHIVPTLVDAAERDPELAELHRSFTAERRKSMVEILQRGVERGELPAGSDLDLLCDLLAGPVFYRRLVTHRPFDRRFAERLADTVLRAAGPPS